jgi:hypothetical protein
MERSSLGIFGQLNWSVWFAGVCVLGVVGFCLRCCVRFVCVGMPVVFSCDVIVIGMLSFGSVLWLVRVCASKRVFARPLP